MAGMKPLVFKKGGKQRLGKGFSLGELKEVKLSLKQALKLGIAVDSRRRTVHEDNVKSLKEFLATSLKPKAKPKAEAKVEKVSKPEAAEKKGKAKSVKKKSSK
ncbi:MAG: ribosomal protein L13e [Candidatus Bathyarchaeia archaeon]